MIDFSKYPRLQRFMQSHPSWTFNECYDHIEELIQEKERKENARKSVEKEGTEE